MITYVPTSGQAVAQTLSRALWRLGQAQPKAVTEDAFLTMTMRDGSVWLVVNTSLSVKIQETAQPGEIAGILEPWIFEELLPSDTLEVLTNLIQASKGKELNLWNAFPELFKAQSRTKEQLVAANLYPTP